MRGNVAGEWRVWGADAWSTRYSPLDQINASNFSSLQVAWTLERRPVRGGDERVLAHHAPLRERPRARRRDEPPRSCAHSIRRPATALWHYRLNEGIRFQKAPRRFAGRGLAYWTDGNAERAIVITPGYHLVSIDAKTGKADAKFGKDGVVDLMDGLGYPLVPLAVDDTGPLEISEAYPPRKARPGEKWDAVKKTGADGTIGIDPADGEIANSSPAIVVGNVIIVGNSAIHGYYRPAQPQHFGHDPRIRRSHREAALEIQSPPAARASTAPTHGRTARSTAIPGPARSIRGRRTARIRISGSCTSPSARGSWTSTAASVPATISSRRASSRST